MALRDASNASPEQDCGVLTLAPWVGTLPQRRSAGKPWRETRRAEDIQCNCQRHYDKLCVLAASFLTSVATYLLTARCGQRRHWCGRGVLGECLSYHLLN